MLEINLYSMLANFPAEWVVYRLEVAQETQAYFQIWDFIESHWVEPVVFKRAN